MLQQILTKVLLSISPAELTALEKKRLSLTIQTGLDPDKVLLWSTLGGASSCSFCCCSCGWNWTCAARSAEAAEAERRLEEQLMFVQMMLDALPNQVVLTTSAMKLR